MLQTWLLAVSIVTGGVVIFAFDRSIRRHGRTPVSYLVFFAMVGAAYYLGLEGLLGAVAVGAIVNGVHAFAARKQRTADTVL